jgi:hypothetical protein
MCKNSFTFCHKVEIPAKFSLNRICALLNFSKTAVVKAVPDTRLLCKGKVVPVHTMKAYRRSRGMAPFILHLGARWRRVVNFTPKATLPPSLNPDTDWTGGWVDLRTALDVSALRNGVNVSQRFEGRQFLRQGLTSPGLRSLEISGSVNAATQRNIPRKPEPKILVRRKFDFWITVDSPHLT